MPFKSDRRRLFELIAALATSARCMLPRRLSARHARVIQLRPPCNCQMNSRVLARRDDHQISGVVVKRIPVLVMNVFRAEKRPSEHMLHDDTMFVFPFFRIANLYEPIGCRFSLQVLQPSTSDGLCSRIVHPASSFPKVRTIRRRGDSRPFLDLTLHRFTLLFDGFRRPFVSWLECRGGCVSRHFDLLYAV